MVCLLVIALMVASTVPVGAIKPPPDDGSDPTGTIFYGQREANDDINIYSMNADGTSKTYLHEWVDGMDAMSLKAHGDDGNYWYAGFIATDDDPHPDGVAKTELRAFRDDNTESVLLLDDPDMSYDEWNGPPCWLIGDTYLSWAALKWGVDAGDNDEVTEAGIYRAEISFGDDDDDPVLTDPTLVWSTGTYGHGTVDARWYTPEVSYPNWSPDGLKVVMSSVENGRTVVDFSTGTGVDNNLGELGTAFWSPDGTKLAYASSGKLHVTDPDGTSDTVLVTVRSNKQVFKDIRNVRWSPDGEFLMYTVLIWKGLTFGASCDIYVIGVDGSGNTCLTRDITTTDRFWGRDWR